VGCDVESPGRNLREHTRLRRSVLLFVFFLAVCAASASDEPQVSHVPRWQFNADLSAVRDLTVTVSCPAPNAVFLPSDEKALDITLTNLAADPRDVQFRSTVFDYRGRGWEETVRSVTLPGADKVRIKEVLSGSRTGFFNLSVEIAAGDNVTVRNFPFAVLPREQRGFRKNSFFGVVTRDLSQTSAYARLGAKWVLAEATARWDRVEPVQGTMELAGLDDMAGIQQANSVFIVPVLGSPPEWAYTVPGETLPGPLRLNEMEPWKEYLAAVAARLKGTISHFAIWEANRFSTDRWRLTSAQYKQLLSTARPSIVAASPNSFICASVPELAFLPEYVGGQDVAFAVDAALVEARDQGDAEYGFRGYVTRVARMLREAGMDAMWVISPQRGGRNPSSDENEPTLLVREYVLAAAAGVKRLFWNCRRSGALLTGEGAPTPAGCAYAVASRKLEGAALARTLWSDSMNLWGFVFNRSDDTRLAVVWQVGSESTLILPEADGFTAAGLMGNSAGSIDGDALTVPLGAQPIYIESKMPLDAFTSGVENAQIDSTRSLSPWVALTGGGDDARLQVMLVNLTNMPMSGAVKVGTPPSLKLTDEARPFGEIAAGQTGIVEFAVSQLVPGNANAYPVDLSVLVAGQEYTTRHVVQVSRVMPVACKLDGGLSEWPADSFCHMDHARFLARPSDRWTPQNLSAAVALGWDDKYLYIAARVDDDVHSPGDAVLVAFDLLPDSVPNGTKKRLVAAGTDAQYALQLVGGEAIVTRRAIQFEPATPVPTGAMPALQSQPTGATVSITRIEDQSRTEYEVAIPFAELGALNPLVAKRVVMNLRVDDGEAPEFSLDWAAPTTNERTFLTFHPFDRLNAPAAGSWYFVRPDEAPNDDN